MAYNNLLLEERETTLVITINRPDQLNALNRQTIEEMNKALALADVNPEIRVIIITGAGEKAFVAGADIKEFAAFSVEEGRLLSRSGHKLLFDFVENMSKPVIAAVNGFALGGGLELAMSCHIRIASENAKMGLPEVSLGVIPGYGGTQRLAQLVGKGKALEMISSAAMISSSDALQWGLVNQVVPLSELPITAEELAKKIARNSPAAISSAFRAVLSGYKKGVNGFETEINEFGICFGTGDFKEGTSAFVEKRKPVFSGK
ncbi:MAG: enoyl-CoA hydratase/isomerase family protein [Crocinitomicaceae bacterium]|nr:enoyl-CoA hydratase/isomerase family protein [Crocinitomicaceae bacterium]